MKIDMKSLAIGVLGSLVVFLALGAKQPSESHSCGRYQVESSEYYAYVIDTTTGQVWGKSGTGSQTFYKSKNLPKQANNDAEK